MGVACSLVAGRHRIYRISCHSVNKVHFVSNFACGNALWLIVSADLPKKC